MERMRRISTVLSRSLSSARSSSHVDAAAQVDAVLRRQLLGGAPPAAAAVPRAGVPRELTQLAVLGLAMGFATGQDAPRPLRYSELDALQKHNVRKAALEAP